MHTLPGNACPSLFTNNGVVEASLKLNCAELPVKTICIVGAGAGGLSALKVILDTPEYKDGLWNPTAFEGREDIGGVWLPAPPTDNPPLTPLYDSLTTNLPHSVMAYPNFPFPPSTPVYPPAVAVQTYLRSYSHHFNLTPHIRLNTSIQDIERDSPNLKWKVHLSTGEFLDFDFVIIANGHHRIPRYPDVRGLSRWLETGRASHSVWYRHPYKSGKTVLVVGGGPSGHDISAEMCAVAERVVHSFTDARSENIGSLKRRGRITEFRDEGQVIFQDGTTETGIDHCILATGYEMAFPFLSKSTIRLGMPPPSPPLPPELWNSSYHLFPLAMHILPLQAVAPSMAFIGLLVRVVPFPLFEAQATAIVQAFAHPESLDTTKEAVDIITRYEDLRREFGDNHLAIAKAWHRFRGQEQFDYRDHLYEFGQPDVGRRITVSTWEKEMYGKKEILRLAWKDLIQTGEADKWVEGVGEKDPDEWVDLLTRMLRRAEERAIYDGNGNNPKL